MDARLATPQARVAEALWRDVAQPGAPAGEFVTEVEPTAGRIASSGPGGRPGCGVASHPPAAAAGTRLRQSGRPAPARRRPAGAGPAGRPPDPRRGAGAAPRPLTPVGTAAGPAVPGAAGPGEAAPPPPGAPGGAFPPSRPPSPGSLSAPRQRRLPARPAPLGEGGGAPRSQRWEQSK